MNGYKTIEITSRTAVEDVSDIRAITVFFRVLGDEAMWFAGIDRARPTGMLAVFCRRDRWAAIFWETRSSYIILQTAASAEGQRRYLIYRHSPTAPPSHACVFLEGDATN